MNENIKNMAELLRKGNKMLNLACPECNTPIFENAEGILFCPTCNREVIVEDIKDKNRKSKEITHSLKKNKDQQNVIDVKNKAVDVLNEKIIWILNSIKNENQMRRIKENLTVLKEMFDLLLFLTSKE